MHSIQRILCAVPVAAALLMAGCGGGGDGGGSQAPVGARLAPEPVKPEPVKSEPVKPEPAPTPSTSAPPSLDIRDPVHDISMPTIVFPDISAFVRMARAYECGQRHNRLHVIHATFVLWSTAGTCGNGAPVFQLYALYPEKRVCVKGENVMGPVHSCNTEEQRILFDKMVKNLDAPNLGMDTPDVVYEVDLDNYQQNWTDIDLRSYSGISTRQELVIKDAATWAEVWTRHAGDQALPKVDFSKKMVIALFSHHMPSGCYGTAVTAVDRTDDGRLVVERTDSYPQEDQPDAPIDSIRLCTMALTQPAHLVMVDRHDGAVQFVTKRRAL